MLSSAAFIKQQATNYKLVEIWDNFEYPKNVADKRIGKIIIYDL